MLKILRNKNVTKIVLWALLILILPAFVLWGTGSMGNKSKGPSFVGMIDNKKVTFEDLYNNVVAIRSQVIMNYFTQPQVIDLMFKNKSFLAKLAWDRIIMLRTADRYKLKITDADVVNYIRSAPIFLRGGQFDNRVYGYILKNNMGIYPRNFEEIVRENLKIQRLNNIIAKDIKPGDRDAADLYKRETAKFKVLYTVIPSADFLEKAAARDDDVRIYYEKNSSEFLIPQKDEVTGEETVKTASFDAVKEDIRKAMTEAVARDMALKQAAASRKEIVGLMDSRKISFSGACAELGLKTTESAAFGKADYVDGVGEAAPLVDAASKLDPGGVSQSPITARAGEVILSVVAIEGFDEMAFEKVKEEYANKALEDKKNRHLESWLRDLERNTTLNIDLGDYEKYYR